MKDKLKFIFTDEELLNLKIVDNFTSTTLTLFFNNTSSLKSSFIETIQSILSSRDRVVNIVYLNDNIDSEECDLNDIEQFIKNVNYYNSDLDCDSNMPKLEIQITKSIINNILSIYSLNDFLNYINTLNLSVFLKLLSQNGEYEPIYFELLYDNNILSFSNRFCFYSKGMPFNKVLNTNNSSKELTNRDMNCNFINNKYYNFSVKDFTFSNFISDDFNTYFNKLSCIYSLISIFNISEIKENTVYLTLLGKSCSEFSLSFDNINIDEISSYKLLYDEIYKENFITDKLEIARNILSIYLLKSSTLYIDDKVIKSIRSNYNIYLRENYDKYIELKMQTVSSLLDLQKEFSKIGNDISDNFIKNLGTLVTFLFTAIILNSLNNDSFTSLFTSDITKVSITILILSTIFVIYTYKLSKKSISDIEHLYTNISCIYNDLLDSAEVENITEKSYYTETKKNLDSKLKWYRNVWIVILPILFISTFTLGYTHIINWVNYFLNHIFK